MNEIDKIKNHPYLSDKSKLATLYAYHRNELSNEEKLKIFNEIVNDRDLMKLTLDIFTRKEDSSLETSANYLEYRGKLRNFLNDLENSSQ